MEWWQAIVLATVEGLTEFLPVSSTAHLVGTSWVLGIAQTEFVKSFELAVQIGGIGAVVPLFISELWNKPKMWAKIAMGFIPTGIVGVVAYDFIKQVLVGNAIVSIAALAIGGIVMIWWEKAMQKKKNDTHREFTYVRALIIGSAQILAMIPGVSRAAATIMGGVMTGLSRTDAVKISFFLAVPTLGAAVGWDLLKTQWSFNANEWQLLGLGIVVAYLVATATIHWLMGFVRTHGMAGFGWYRIVIAGLWGISLWL